MARQPVGLKPRSFRAAMTFAKRSARGPCLGELIAGPGGKRVVRRRPVGRLSCVWQALLDIRDARQEDGLVLVPRISAENIFVPVVRGRTVLHDVGGCLQLSWA